MSFWQQLNQLLSEAPGNVVYHLVTLFAIQATLAIAFSQWRRERELPPDRGRSELARRLTLAALGLFITRFLLLIASLVVAGSGDPTLPMRILPPLEQAVNSATAILIVWALLPTFPSLPRFNDVAVVLVLLLAGVMYAFFAQDWASNAQPGMIYNGSEQSTIWGAFQIVVLLMGAVLLLLRKFPGGGLRFLIMVALLAAHAVQFWNYPETVPSNTEIPFWIRLGHLVALPLLGVVAYRYTVSQLLAAQLTNRSALEQVAVSLQMASQVIQPPDLRQRIDRAVGMTAQLTDAAFVAIAVPASDDAQQLDLVGRQQGDEDLRPWALKREDWPSFRMAMDQNEVVELAPNGIGARQLHDFYQELGLDIAGPLLIIPLQSDEEQIGVLLLASEFEEGAWSEEVRSVAPHLGQYVTQALSNARGKGRDLVATVTTETVPEQEQFVSGRVIALESELESALEERETLAARLQQTESQLQTTRQKARDLAATVEEFERNRSGDEYVQSLEAEVKTLRESLIEAEEAMAMAAAAEGELSTEWVTTTISRYSGELEEAQVRLDELEAELARHESDEVNQVLTSLAQELRTPLTSVAGYTDLLLGETMGILGTHQRDFLQRVKANVERAGVLLDQIVQLATAPSRNVTIRDVELVDVNELIESAVNTIITELRKKELRLNLDVDESLPPVPANRDALSQVLIHLLSNASQASVSRGEMTISCHADTLREVDKEGVTGAEHFVHVAIRDSGGGISPEDRSHVFDPQYRAENPLIAGLGDTGAGLSVAQTLVAAHGGRLWVESDMGEGSTFSVLLPLSHNGDGDAPADDV
ncbi:MAG: ATP-binding protein [Chloroflexota bacterium]